MVRGNNELDTKIPGRSCELEIRIVVTYQKMCHYFLAPLTPRSRKMATSSMQILEPILYAEINTVKGVYNK